MRFDCNRPHRGHFGGRGHHFARHFAAWFDSSGDARAERHAGRFDDDDSFGGGRFGGGPFGGGGFGGGRGGPFGGGRGRGGRGRMFAGGELRLLLLSLVAEQDRHGYELIKAIEELTVGAYAPSPGVVYPTLALLGDEGLIAEAAGEGTRKAFTVTEAGRTELAGRGAELKAIVDRLTGLAEAGAREASPPVRRAFANLALALRQRVGGKAFDEATAHAVADILDEAARKIERL